MGEEYLIRFADEGAYNCLVALNGEALTDVLGVEVRLVRGQVGGTVTETTRRRVAVPGFDMITHFPTRTIAEWWAEYYTAEGEKEAGFADYGTTAGQVRAKAASGRMKAALIVLAEDFGDEKARELLK